METLPKDVIVKIAMELSPPEFIKLCLTNKNLKKQICDNRDLWVKKLEKDYPHALYTTQVLNLTLANPRNAYIRNFTEIQKGIDKFIIDADRAPDQTKVENIKKELYMFISKIINDTPQDEHVNFDGLKKFLDEKSYLYGGFFGNPDVLYELERSENRKRDQIKELRKI